MSSYEEEMARAEQEADTDAKAKYDADMEGQYLAEIQQDMDAQAEVEKQKESGLIKETIKVKCKEIEKEKGIKILFSVENGSRAWGIDSSNSDYDVRFVFVKTVREYLCLNPSDEVITASFDKEGKRVAPEGCFFDFVGFDIFKFCRMLTSSNPQVIEWLRTDILYYGERNKVFTDYALNNFKPIALYYHYKSMCRDNFKDVKRVN